jgi:curved DNA-binding protein CbpA
MSLTTEIKTFFEDLELDNTSTLDETKKQYRSLAKKWHPDKNLGKNTSEEIKKINEAWEKLQEFFEKKTTQQEAKQKLEEKQAKMRQQRKEHKRKMLRELKEKRENEEKILSEAIAQAKRKRDEEKKQMLKRMKENEAEQVAQEEIHGLWFDATKIKSGQACICLQFVSSTCKSDVQKTTLRGFNEIDFALNHESQFILAMNFQAGKSNIGPVTVGRSRDNRINPLHSLEISKNAVQISCCDAYDGSVTITSLVEFQQGPKRRGNCIKVYTVSAEGKKEVMHRLRAGDQTQCQFTIPENGLKDIFIEIGPHVWKFKRYANMPSTQAVAPVAPELVQKNPRREFYVDDDNHQSYLEVVDILAEVEEVDFCKW